MPEPLEHIDAPRHFSDGLVELSDGAVTDEYGFAFRLEDDWSWLQRAAADLETAARGLAAVVAELEH